MRTEYGEFHVEGSRRPGRGSRLDLILVSSGAEKPGQPQRSAVR